MTFFIRAYISGEYMRGCINVGVMRAGNTKFKAVQKKMTG